MMKRLLSISTALSLSLWQVASAYAGHNEPVQLSQTPAYTGDCAKPAGSGVTTCSTIKGKTVLPIDGSVPLSGALPMLSVSFSQLSSMTGTASVVYCSDCLKPGEVTGSGTGILVFRDATKWNTVAGATASN